MTPRLARLSILVVVLGCAGPKSTAEVPLKHQRLSDDEIAELREKLHDLDAVLRQKSPEVHARLLAPADSRSIDQLRESLGGIQNDYLEVWFTWHDGSTGGGAGLLPLGGAITSAEAIADREMTRSIAGMTPSRRRDIKLLDDGAGDGFFLNLSSPAGEVYYEMLEDPFPQSYGSFEQFLDFLHAVHAAGIADINPRGVVVFDEAAYRSLEAQHFATIEEE